MAELPSEILLRAAGPMAPLQRTALWIAGLAGWRRHGLAAVLGALAAKAMAPVDLAPFLNGTVDVTPVLVVSFSGLVWLLDGTTGRRDALLLGWSFGFGFFVAGLYWIAAALFVDIAQFWWLVPFTVAAVPAGFALFTALALLAAYEARRRFALVASARILALALAWSAAEYLRGHVLTGFPWNLVGYTWAGGFPGSLDVLQLVSVTGIYGLSLVTVTAAALPARLGDFGRGRWAAVAAALLLIAAPAAAGAWRLAHGLSETVSGVTLRLVQPSIPQTLKNDPQAEVQNFQRLLALSAAQGADKITAVIWPEAAAPPLLERYPNIRQAIAAVVPRGGLLITGAERAEPAQGWPPLHVWNSVVALDDKGAIVGTYDKAHLVPFGEYVPLRGLLPMEKIAPSIGDFSRGPGPRTLSVPGLPAVSPLICYEAIFPGAVTDPQHRPHWLLNVTNDAWYGRTPGPLQHLASARTRAVEEGLPLMRAANNGISAAIDPYGRVLARLDLDAVGVLDEPLPRDVAGTVYAQFGDSTYLALALLFLASIALLTRYEVNRTARP
ncbi:MAG TPA: apolipoprotein N-acyltransferase [Stellaceae bacterium]|nr:apolipoprotein N-acyltransferase [Stellaceae bacterium]